MSLPRCHRIPKVGLVKCEDCDLSNKGKSNCVPGRGPKGRIMVIGDKLGPADVKRSDVWRGREGNKLSYILEEAGIDIEQCYITQALKCPIAKSKKPKKSHVKNCRHHLLEELMWVRPSVIITVGGLALDMLLNPDPNPNKPKYKVMENRGFAIPIKDSSGQVFTWVVPTVSVDHLFKDPEYIPVSIRDAELAKKIYDSKGKFSLPKMPYSTKFITDLESLNALCRRLVKSSGFSFDLETNGFDFLKDDILCFSFCMEEEPHTGYVVPLYKSWGNEAWSKEESDYVIRCMKHVFLSDVSKYAQNGKFDVKFLWTLGIKVRKFNFDTMLAHHLVAGSAPQHNLTFISQELGFIHENYEKKIAEQKVKHQTDRYGAFDWQVLFHYAGLDAIMCLLAKRDLANELVEYGVQDVFKKISMPQSRLLADMEYHGARIDRPEANDKLMRFNGEAKEVNQKLSEITKIPDFNPNSPKQIKEYFKRKRIKLGKITESGQFSTDSESLKALTARGVGGDVPKLIIRSRELQKLISTYLKNDKGDKGLIPKLDDRGYLHSNFKIIGTYCVARGTTVLTELGQLPIEELVNELPGFSIPKVLIKVWDGERWRYPAAGYYSGFSDGIIIKTKSGRSLHATPNHPILVKVRHIKCWKRFRDLKRGDMAVVMTDTGRIIIDRIESVRKKSGEFFDLCMGDEGEDFLFWEDAEIFSSMMSWIKRVGDSNPATSERNRKNWQDPEYRKKMITMHREKAKKQHKDKNFVKKFRTAQKEFMNKMAGTSWMRLKNSKANKTKWKDPDYRKARSNFIREANIDGRMGQVAPNGAETKLSQILEGLPIKFTGGRQFWVRMPDGTAANPDFKVDGKKAVIELFGDYWHKGENPNSKISRYRKSGFKAIVIWECELKNPEKVRRRVEKWLRCWV